jgi:hypothetical protein
MKRSLVLIVLMCLAISGLTCAEKVVDLPDVLKAQSILIAHNRLFVAEQAKIYIYSLDDFKLIKKFGKRGEGPMEFMGAISWMAEGKNSVLISSQNKVSRYSPDGEFLEEKKAKSGIFSGFYQSVKENFTGVSMKTDKGVLYLVISLYDKDFNKLKELARYVFAERGKMNFLNMMRMISCFTYKDKIYIAGEKGFTINVLDSNGKQLHTITRDYKPRKLTVKDKEDIKELFKQGMPAPQWEAIKDRIVFSEFYPEILLIHIANDIIYVSTWKKKGDLNEIFLYNLDGTFIKQKFIPIVLQPGDAIRPYPATFYDGKLYQLIEDEDDEIWKLHINDIK